MNRNHVSTLQIKYDELVANIAQFRLKRGRSCVVGEAWRIISQRFNDTIVYVNLPVSKSIPGAIPCKMSHIVHLHLKMQTIAVKFQLNDEISDLIGNYKHFFQFRIIIKLDSTDD